MGIGLAFWLIYILWIVFAIWSHYPYSDANARKGGVGFLFVAALFF